MSKLPQNQELWIDIRDLIEDARQNVSRTVNTTLTVTYWKIGERINVEILEKRACSLWGIRFCRQCRQNWLRIM